jgi:hypothetical protein
MYRKDKHYGNVDINGLNGTAGDNYSVDKNVAYFAKPEN